MLMIIKVAFAGIGLTVHARAMPPKGLIIAHEFEETIETWTGPEDVNKMPSNVAPFGDFLVRMMERFTEAFNNIVDEAIPNGAAAIDDFDGPMIEFEENGYSGWGGEEGADSVTEEDIRYGMDEIKKYLGDEENEQLKAIIDNWTVEQLWADV